MKLTRQLKKVLFKKREIHINNSLIEIRIQYVLFIPIFLISIILLSAFMGVFMANLIFTV